jgi:alpha 1,6-mannosyltransferase
VANITEETLRLKSVGELNKSKIRSIVEFTGPALWTDKVFDFFNNPDYFDMSTSTGNITWREFTGITKAKKVGDVVVLPITSFSPGVKQMGAGEDDDPMAFVKHNFEGESNAKRYMRGTS